MRFVIEAGTDAAEVILFDPESLPADFDAQVQDDPAAVLERLMGEGRAFVTETGGDGRFLLHAYVNEPVPVELGEHTRDPRVIDPFLAASGRLYFAGVEYAFRNDDSFLQKYPHMGGYFEVPPGVYKLTMYRTEYPGGLQEERLRQQVSGFRFWLHRGMGWLVTLAVLSLIGLVVGYFNFPRQPAYSGLLLGLAFLVALPIVVYRSKPFQETKMCYERIQREYPTMIAWLEARD